MLLIPVSIVRKGKSAISLWNVGGVLVSLSKPLIPCVDKVLYLPQIRQVSRRHCALYKLNLLAKSVTYF